MYLKYASKTFLAAAITFLFFNSSLACEFGLDEMPKTNNIFTPELIWGLFIILFHMAIGLVHTWFKEKKDKNK